MRAVDGSGELAVPAYELFSQTETALAELLAADLSGLDLVALMVDGVHYGEHTCVVALVGLRERGLDVTRSILVMLDGSKALRRAVSRRVRPPGDPEMPASQDQKRAGSTA